MRNRGFTLTETLICLALMAILGAIAFSLAQAPREAARQASCAARLKQIYQGILLYDANNAGSERLSQFIDLPRAPIQNPSLLVAAVGTEGLFCPDTPSCARKRMGSSYTWNGLPEGESKSIKNGQSQVLARMETQGMDYGLVTCYTHDEMFYYPSERQYDEELNPPFIIELKAGGNITRGRMHRPRFHDIAKICGSYGD